MANFAEENTVSWNILNLDSFKNGLHTTNCLCSIKMSMGNCAFRRPATQASQMPMLYKYGNGCSLLSITKSPFMMIVCFQSFWPRATLKGPKKTFVVVFVVVLGVESISKNVPGNKKCFREQKMCLGTKNVLKGTKSDLGNKKCSYKSKWNS